MEGLVRPAVGLTIGSRSCVHVSVPPARRLAAPRTHKVKVVAVAESPTQSPQEVERGQWKPDSWKRFTAHQQPNYPDQETLLSAVQEITNLPPLVFAGECRNLQARLAKCAAGEAFLLQGGDCAESFTALSANRIRDAFRVMLQMAVTMQYGGGIPVVKVGRMAGQFAKPRSADLETIDGVSLPSYRGDIINGPEFTEAARVPEPARLVKAYNQSAATLNLLRAFATGGYAGLDRIEDWNLSFMERSEKGQEYLATARQVEQAIRFMVACGMNLDIPIMRETEFFVSHECLLMDYEQALTREDSTTGGWYDCSGHLLWCGERTRQLDGAHLEFMRGIQNPIGVKVSDKMDPGELVMLIATLNPANTPGRLAVIVRMGAKKVRDKMPALVEAVQQAGQVVTWVCDPMHGNTESCGGYKTRRFENVRAEVEAFFDVHEDLGTIPGGIHLEMTGDDVTECLGGGSAVAAEDLDSRYHTHCDPRLNAAQALEMSFYIAGRLHKRRERLEMEKKAKA